MGANLKRRHSEGRTNPQRKQKLVRFANRILPDCLVVSLFLIIFAPDICKVQPLTPYSMRFKHLAILIAMLSLIGCSSKAPEIKSDASLVDLNLKKQYFQDEKVSKLIDVLIENKLPQFAKDVARFI